MSNLTGRPIYQKGNKPEASKGVRSAAQGADCTLAIPGVCCNDKDTVVFCHLRIFNLAGAGQKPDDLFGVDACHKCHAVLDSRDRWERSGLTYKMILWALIRSQRRRRSSGIIKLGE